MTIGHTWSSYYELVKIRRIPEGWKRSVLEEAEKRTISYFSFHSSDCSRPVRNICILEKAFLHFGDRCKWKGSCRMEECKGIAALLSAGPFCESFSSATAHILLSNVYDASVSQTISCDFALKFTRDSLRSLCSRFLSVSLSLPLAEFCLATRSNPFVTPCAILSTHENRRRMTRAKISRGGRSLMLKSLQDAGVSKVLRDY